MPKLQQRRSGDAEAIFQALGDGARRVMFDQMLSGPASVSELAKPLAMSLPTILQHLQVLEASGLVRSRKQGRKRICTLAPQALKSGEEWFASRRVFWEDNFDRLEAQLSEAGPGIKSTTSQRSDQ